MPNRPMCFVLKRRLRKCRPGRPVVPLDGVRSRRRASKWASRRPQMLWRMFRVVLSVTLLSCKLLASMLLSLGCAYIRKTSIKRSQLFQDVVVTCHTPSPHVLLPLTFHLTTLISPHLMTTLSCLLLNVRAQAQVGKKSGGDSSDSLSERRHGLCYISLLV